jgi:hypothetical protein
MRLLTKHLTILSIALCGCGDLDSSELDHDEVEAVPGETGPRGQTGAAGSSSVILDQDGIEVGYYLERIDFDENTFEILTVDGVRTVLDLDDASFEPPMQLGSGLGFSCVYESADCSGACFGVDGLARGYILKGADGSVYAVDGDELTTSITAESHNKTSAPGTCVVQTIALPTAVPAIDYDGILTETLAIPLYIDIKN